MTLSKAGGGGEGENQAVDSVFSSHYEQTPVPKYAHIFSALITFNVVLDVVLSFIKDTKRDVE